MEQGQKLWVVWPNTRYKGYFYNSIGWFERMTQDGKVVVRGMPYGGHLSIFEANEVFETEPPNWGQGIVHY